MARKKAAGAGSDERQLNGPQTTGREYRNLSEIGHEMAWDDDVVVETRDGTKLLVDVYRPKEEGTYPVSYRIPLVSTAHRFVVGHRVGLVIVSDDQPESTPSIMGFRHPPVTPAVRAGIWSSSRLVFPVLSP